MMPQETLQDRVDRFLAGDSYAVVGASRQRSKYGNKVLRSYLQNHRRVYPVNPYASEIEGLPVSPDLRSLPGPVHGISVITPPEITREIIDQAAELGIQHVWLQPGAEDDEAVERAGRAGIHLLSGGPCLLVALGFRED